MLSEYLTAAIVAALAAVTGLKDDRVPYWWRWNKPAVTGAGATIASIYASCGLLLCGLANAADLHPFTGHPVAGWANGTVYGILTLAVLRPDILAVILTPLSAGLMLAERLIALFSDWLEVGAARCVSRRVGNLRVEPLIAASLHVFYRHDAPEAVLEWAVEAAEAVLGGLHEQVRTSEPPRDSDQAALTLAPVEYLRHYVATVIVREHDATIALEEEPRLPALFRSARRERN